MNDPAPEKQPTPPTPDEMRHQMRAVEADVFTAMNALWFGINKRLINVFGCTLDTENAEAPALLEIVACKVNEDGSPIIERFSASNHIDALKLAGKAAHLQLMEFHKQTNGAGDYLQSLQALKEMRKPQRRGGLILPSRS